MGTALREIRIFLSRYCFMGSGYCLVRKMDIRIWLLFCGKNGYSHLVTALWEIRIVLCGYCLVGNSDIFLWVLPCGKLSCSYLGTAFWEIRIVLCGYCLLGNSNIPMWVLPFGKFGPPYHLTWKSSHPNWLLMHRRRSVVTQALDTSVCMWRYVFTCRYKAFTICMKYCFAMENTGKLESISSDCKSSIYIGVQIFRMTSNLF